MSQLRTGFLTVSDGVMPDYTTRAGVEEMPVFALLQTLAAQQEKMGQIETVGLMSCVRAVTRDAPHIVCMDGTSMMCIMSFTHLCHAAAPCHRQVDQDAR